jgi:ParB family chromosome partitioning protein
MVESNFQRTTILPSEKAFAYRMRLEAMKRQAGRPSKNNIVPVGQNYSREVLSDQTGDSQTQIQRYIRLTYLIPELLKLVDEGRMKMRPAVELSYLNPYYQQFVLDEIELNECTPSHAQTIRMRKLADEHALDADIISDIMSEEKPNQKTERLAFNAARVRKLLPDDLPKEKTEDFICEAITFYRKYYRERSARSSDRDAR